MKYLISFSLFSFFILLSSCEKEKELELDDNYKLDLGYTVSFNDDAFQIHFDKVLSYFICPFNADCEMPDYVKIQMITTENEVEKYYEFSSYPMHLDTIFQTGLGDLRFEIKKINPFPEVRLPDQDELSVEFNLKLLD